MRCSFIGIENSTAVNSSGGIFGCVGWVLASLVATVAVVTGWDKVAKVDGIEWVQSLGQIVVISLAPTMVFA